jgi:hypothetical protein
MIGAGCRGGARPTEANGQQGCRASLQEIRKAIEEAWTPEGETLRRVEVSPIPGHPGLFVALMDVKPRWFGDWACFAFEGGRIVWRATVREADATTTPAIESVRGRLLRGVGGPIVEVVTRTHMGNGELVLYELSDKELRCVLRTSVLDVHWGDGLVIRGGVLSVSYVDVNADGCDDVVLDGMVDEVEDDGQVVTGTGRVHREFVWSPEDRSFVESGR